MSEIDGTTTVQAEVPAQTVDISPQSSRERSRQHQGTDPSMPARTTYQEDLTAEGQRDINRIWETTQMKIALSVIWTALAVAAILAVFSKQLGTADIQLAAVVFVFGVANLVTGFYFGRTNHTKVGGVGAHESGR